MAVKHDGKKRFLVDRDGDAVVVRIEVGDAYYARVLYEDIVWNLQKYQGFKVWVENPPENVEPRR